MNRSPLATVLPRIYFGAAHLALITALGIVALRGEQVGSSPLHPLTLTVVHLVTLGWITCSIFGATYVVGPLALRLPLPTGSLDRIVCGVVLLGASGVASHFWIDGYSGLTWSAALLALALLAQAARVLIPLALSPTPAVIRLPIALAWANGVLAVGLGGFVAADRALPILPGGHIAALQAHAHLAAVGFGVMMVVGVGFRLLPMFLPAAPPAGILPWSAVAMTEVGVLGLAASRLLAPAGTELFALLLAAGVTAFLLCVLRMLCNRRPPPRALRQPDPAMVLALLALGYLAVAVGLGVHLAVSEDPQPTLWPVYGAIGLVGFLAQLIVGVAMRLLPLFAWRVDWQLGEHRTLPPSPHATPLRPLQWLTVAGWVPGVPALVVGVGTTAAPWVAAGGWLLLSGTLAAAANAVLVLRRSRRMLGEPV